MNLGILSRNADLYSTRRLLEAAEQRGHQVRVIDYLRCYMNITSKSPKVLYAGKEVQCDAVIPRIGASHTFYGAAVVRQFEMMQVVCANDSQAITRARDKLRALQILSGEGVGLPITSFAHSTKDIAGLIDIVGGAPLIVKLLEGTQGVGVVLAETNKAAESVIASFRKLDANILVQEFIREADGCDIRAFVVGGEVVAAMMRRASEGDFRSNLHRGGRAEAVTLSDEERDNAVRAVQALGLDVAGVDMLRSSRGPLVIEVNASPGLEGIERATSINVAASILAFVEQQRSKQSARYSTSSSSNS